MSTDIPPPPILPTIMKIKAKPISQSVNLVFSFTPLSDPNPSVVWRAAQFGYNQGGSLILEYSPNFRFIAPAVKDHRIKGEEAMCNIEIGQQTDFVASGSTQYDYFTPPVAGAPNSFTVTNTSKNSADIAFGFPSLLTGQLINVALYFPDIESKGIKSVQWTPTLYAYTFPDGHHEQNDIIHKAELDPIWKQDLDKMPHVSNWELVNNGGTYSLIPADSE